MADRLAPIILRFLVAFIACLYLRVGYAIWVHCEDDEALWWCAVKITFSPFLLILDLATDPEPELWRIFAEISFAALILTALWTMIARRHR
jgi:hypothetical protein